MKCLNKIENFLVFFFFKLKLWLYVKVGISNYTF